MRGLFSLIRKQNSEKRIGCVDILSVDIPTVACVANCFIAGHLQRLRKQSPARPSEVPQGSSYFSGLRQD